jgi:hypothetical protein
MYVSRVGFLLAKNKVELVRIVGSLLASRCSSVPFLSLSHQYNHLRLPFFTVFITILLSSSLQ